MAILKKIMVKVDYIEVNKLLIPKIHFSFFFQERSKSIPDCKEEGWIRTNTRSNDLQLGSQYETYHSEFNSEISCHK